MRNGNSSLATFFLQRMSSYRTYEEWKHLKTTYNFVTTEFLPYLWGMETQGKVELLYLSSQFLPYLWGMETMPILKRNIYPLLVLTVPMRNGNEHEQPEIYKKYLFLPYLWGMETKIFRTPHYQARAVLTVPMRNGNVVTPKSTVKLYIVLTVPMRNGNERNCQDYSNSSRVLTVPMRNGNRF